MIFELNQIIEKTIKIYEKSPCTIEELSQTILNLKAEKIIPYNELAKNVLLARGYIWKNGLSLQYWLDFSELVGIHWKILSYLFDVAVSGEDVDVNRFRYEYRGKKIDVLKLPIGKQREHWFCHNHFT